MRMKIAMPWCEKVEWLQQVQVLCARLKMQYYLSPVNQLAVWQGLVEFAVRTGTVHLGQNRDVW